MDDFRRHLDGLSLLCICAMYHAFLLVNRHVNSCVQCDIYTSMHHAVFIAKDFAAHACTLVRGIVHVRTLSCTVL